MPEISRFFGIVIRMFPGDHPPPHFHAEYSGVRFSINIRTGALIDGAPAARQLLLAGRWLELHRAELLENWDRVERELPPNKIPGLQ